MDGANLTISWTAIDKGVKTYTIDLDIYVGVANGRLVWGRGYTDFSRDSSSFKLDGMILVANINGRESRLHLERHIVYTAADGGSFGPLPEDPAFSRFMSEGNWMNLTIVTKPDMSSFLEDAAFRNAVSGVARRAVENVMLDTQFMMETIVKKSLEAIREQAEFHIEKEMQRLITAAAIDAAYSNIARLTMMGIDEKQAYNLFASRINAPLV